MSDDVRAAEAAALDEMRAHLRAEGVPEHIVEAIQYIGPDSQYAERWVEIRKSCLDVVAERTWRGTPENLVAYIQVLVAHQIAEQDKLWPAEDLQKLEKVLNTYYNAHIKPHDEPEDYARGLHDVKARVLAGAIHISHAGPDALTQQQHGHWYADIDRFGDALARHEYTRADGAEVKAWLEQVNQAYDAQLAGMNDDLARLSRLVAYHGRGPSHLEALEMQWLSYRFNSAILKPVAARDRMIGSLQRATIESLRTAAAYCWSPTPATAVVSAGAGLPPDVTLSPFALGDLGAPATSGWWWFEEPIPVTTLGGPGASKPVCALLWRREVHPNQGPRVWFQTMVMDDVPFNGRVQPVPVPTTAWLWPDGTSLGDLPDGLRRGYDTAYHDKGALAGVNFAGVETTVEASMFFSRFFLAAATWLRQRIAVVERGAGIRQVARRLQREHKLPHTPVVEVVQLRRREVVTRAAGDAAAKREFSCRWIVHGHMRNQWYPSKGVHAPKWIDSFLKGPDDKPLKQATRVYAVTR